MTFEEAKSMLNTTPVKATVNSTFDKILQSNIKTLPLCELDDGKQSSMITLPLKNTGSNDITLIFGTPLGVIEEYQNEVMYPNITNHFLDNLSDLEDAESVNRLINLNRRLVRKPLLIGQIEVITPDDTLGATQRSQKITELSIPINNIDSVKIGGAFVPQNTFITGAKLLNKGKIFGDFFGIAYVLKAGAEAQFNFYIGSIDTPNFKIK